MEQESTHPQLLPKIDSIEAEIGKIEEFVIGRHKYEQLKSIKPENRTEEEKSKMEYFESKNCIADPDQIKKNTTYLQELLVQKEKISFSISAKKLWELFKANFQEVNFRPFIKIEGVTIKNLEPLIYYFSKDERFFECENLSKLSVPSFEKGLLIVGTFGNGKTSMMKVFEFIFKGINGYGFKGYSANEVVLLFEKCIGKDAEFLRAEFEKTMYRGTRYFDDVKTERIASNFGKVNIFKEIIEERYNRKSKTFVTCNFKDGFEGDLNIAIDEFGEKYGPRVYDRLFEMFNIIEFKGKSFRK